INPVLHVLRNANDVVGDKSRQFWVLLNSARGSEACERIQRIRISLKSLNCFRGGGLFGRGSGGRARLNRRAVWLVLLLLSLFARAIERGVSSDQQCAVIDEFIQLIGGVSNVQQIVRDNLLLSHGTLFIAP